jgi:hypothetical protein
MSDIWGYLVIGLYVWVTMHELKHLIREYRIRHKHDDNRPPKGYFHTKDPRDTGKEY